MGFPGVPASASPPRGTPRPRGGGVLSLRVLVAARPLAAGLVLHLGVEWGGYTEQNDNLDEGIPGAGETGKTGRTLGGVEGVV